MMRHLRVLAVLTAFVLALTGCGGSDDVAEEGGAATTPEAAPATTPDLTETAPATTPEPAATTPATTPQANGTETAAGMEPTSTEPAAMSAGATVAVASSDLGDILVDGEGMTLYLLTRDTPGESTCAGDCAVTWPPFEADGEPQAGEGADAALLGTIEREDGSMQVTYGDWPLYYFQGDATPGETNGQGAGDVWWVVTPEGEAVEEGG